MTETLVKYRRPADGQVITVRCATAEIAEDMAARYRKARIEAWTEDGA